jgi:hypothetical protein
MLHQTSKASQFDMAETIPTPLQNGENSEKERWYDKLATISPNCNAAASSVIGTF